jgi:ABC-type antimicrobial peptide transport system permease subunit
VPADVLRPWHPYWLTVVSVVGDVKRESRAVEAAPELYVSYRQLGTTVIAIVAGIALLLAVIGIYGVVAYNVSQRTREMGIRAAVGATPAANGLLVLRQGAWMILTGTIAGSVRSIAATRSMQSMLFDVAPLDLRCFALLTQVAFAACYIPARKASSIDPVIALRNE